MFVPRAIVTLTNILFLVVIACGIAACWDDRGTPAQPESGSSDTEPQAPDGIEPPSEPNNVPAQMPASAIPPPPPKPASPPSLAEAESRFALTLEALLKKLETAPAKVVGSHRPSKGLGDAVESESR